MDDLTEIGLICCSAIVAVLGNMIASEFYDRCAPLAEFTIDRAVSKLRKSDQARYREEWFSHLAECTGNITKLLHAMGCYVASVKLKRGHFSFRDKCVRNLRRNSLHVNVVMFEKFYVVWRTLMKVVVRFVGDPNKLKVVPEGTTHEQHRSDVLAQRLNSVSNLIQSYSSIADLMQS
jgi:hypothetical protein